MNHKDNHGQVGEALKIKMTLRNFNEYTGKVYFIEDKTELSVEELRKMDFLTLVPIVIDESTQGDYEVICEHGIEVRYYND